MVWGRVNLLVLFDLQELVYNRDVARANPAEQDSRDPEPRALATWTERWWMLVHIYRPELGRFAIVPQLGKLPHEQRVC
jgi:hypothetical protein